MCGLVGIAGALEIKDEDMMKRLLVNDYWRGKDSTGLASVSKQNSVSVAKIASHPFDLFDMGRFKTALSGTWSKLFLGHNRAATKGSVNAYNAHPFHFGSIVGAHNGTLSLKSHKALEDAIGEKFEVDSQALICAIDRIGIDETVKLLQGAWAITYFDTVENKFNFIRNGERPLFYAYSKDFKKVFWASEYWMIDVSAAHSKQELAVFTTAEKREYRFLGVEENWLYSFDLAELMAGPAERPKPKVKELKGMEEAKAEDPFGRAGFQASLDQTTPPHVTKNGNVTSALKERLEKRKKERGRAQQEVDEKIINFIGSASNPFAGMIKPDEFAYMTKHGCSWCRKPIHEDALGVVVHLRDQMVLCPDCTPAHTHDHVRIFVENIKLYK